MGGNLIIDKEAFKALAISKGAELGLTSADFSLMKTPAYMTNMLMELLDHTAVLAQNIQRESHVSTAETMDALIKLGKDSGYTTDNFATPASANILLSLNLEDILGASTEVAGGKYVYLINKDTMYIDINGKPFSFDYDIEIDIIKNVGVLANVDEYTYRARFVAGDYVNPLDINTENKDKPISTSSFRSTKDGNEMIGLYIPVKQYIRSSEEIRYTTTGESDVKSFKYSNMLAEFSLFYRDKDYDISERQIAKSKYFDKTDVTLETMFYKVKAADTINILNKKNGNFIPLLNSLIRVEKFETLGSQGEFIYNGTDISFISHDISIRHSVAIINQPVNGLDPMSKEELRLDIKKNNSERKSINNTEDLKRHFDMNAGIYKIMKTRHDFFDLIYSIVVCLKNTDTNMVYHTNTLDIDVNLNAIKPIDGRFYRIDKNDIYHYEVGRPAYPYALTDEDVEVYIYSSPFQLVYDKQTNYVDLYERYVDRVYSLKPTLINSNIKLTYLINRMTFTKDVNFPYIVSFNLMTTLPLDQKIPLHIVSEMPTIVDAGVLKVRMVIKSRGVMLGYIEPTLFSYNIDEDYYTYAITEFLEDDIHGDKIIAYMKNMKGADIRVPDMPIDNVTFDIYCFTKRDDGLKQDDTLFIDMSDYILSNIISSDVCDFYRNISYVNKIKAIQVSSSKVKLKAVPLIGKDMFDPTPNEIYEKLNFELDKIKEIYELTEQNYSLNIAFTNSYGFAQKYMVGINMDVQLTALSIALNFTIKIKKTSELTELDFMTLIQAEVNKIDFNNGAFFHASLIIDTIMRTYPDDVMLVEFGGIEDLPASYQYIGLLNDSTTKLMTPEILNINHLYSPSLQTYIPDINIRLIRPV